MPALQVRDFPEDLYGELRECASVECRSIANQVIYILRDYLRAYRRLQCEEERFARIEERKGLFARIHALPKFEVPDGFPDPADLVREDRDGRPSDAMLGVGA